MRYDINKISDLVEVLQKAKDEHGDGYVFSDSDAFCIGAEVREDGVYLEFD